MPEVSCLPFCLITRLVFSHPLCLGSQAHSFSVDCFVLSSFLSISPGKGLKSCTNCKIIILEMQCLDKICPTGGLPDLFAILCNEFTILRFIFQCFCRLCIFQSFSQTPRGSDVQRAGNTSHRSGRGGARREGAREVFAQYCARPSSVCFFFSAFQ